MRILRSYGGMQYCEGGRKDSFVLALLVLSQPEAVLRMALALALGALVGAERQRGDRPAGMRTHALVCLGSTVFMLVSAYAFPELTQASGGRVDPTRIAAQVVSGIGFLGAGMIFTQRNVTRGLTTAAGLWVVAAIGLGIGAGMYFIAAGSTVLMLVVLAILKPLEARLFNSRSQVTVRVVPEAGQLGLIRDALKAQGIRPRSILISPYAGEQELIEISCAPTSGIALEGLITALRSMPGFVDVELNRLSVMQDERD
jgi:putative Mg2+ transporter-C (MgtC) family protein